MLITHATKEKDIKRVWHVVDLEGKTLGRAAVAIALLLMGKSKPYYVRHLDCGDFVVVVNAQNVLVTGKKETKKIYYRYSGYPGGLKKKTLSELRQSKPEEIILHAVKGMLPQNKLRDRMLKRLKVFSGSRHPYAEELKKESSQKEAN